MLAYAHINLLAMLQRFEPEDAVRVATDTSMSENLHFTSSRVSKHMWPLKDVSVGRSRATTFLWSPQPNGVTRTRSSTCPWNMQLTSPSLIIRQQRRTSLPAPRRATTTRCRGTAGATYAVAGGSGKTTRAIELFRQRDSLVFTPTHRLAKEMLARGVQAQTYHSFFR